jgi:hypothetical protein
MNTADKANHEHWTYNRLDAEPVSEYAIIVGRFIGPEEAPVSEPPF